MRINCIQFLAIRRSILNSSSPCLSLIVSNSSSPDGGFLGPGCTYSWGILSPRVTVLTCLTGGVWNWWSAWLSSLSPSSCWIQTPMERRHPWNQCHPKCHSLSTSDLPNRRAGPWEKRELGKASYENIIAWKEPEKWAKDYTLGAQKGQWGRYKGKTPKSMNKGVLRPQFGTCCLDLFRCTRKLGWSISKHKQKVSKSCAQGLVLSSCWEPCRCRQVDKPVLASCTN